MYLICDENILFGKEAFKTIGSVKTCSGRAILQELIKNADVLCVRSITNVTAQLLDTTNVKFVATTSSGSEHIDKDYLEKHGIGFADAVGANAESVAEYVVACLFLYMKNMGWSSLQGKSCGVIGVGNVGTKVAAFAKKLGMSVVLCDPPRMLSEPSFVSEKLEAALSADVVTLHVPFTTKGEYATNNMINLKNLSIIKKNACLINTSRGGVLNEEDLKYRLKQKKDLFCCIDVWKNEPKIDAELAALANVATAHIAGHSWNGKVNATKQIYEKICEHFNLRKNWNIPKYPDKEIFCIRQPDSLSDAALKVYNPLDDTKDLREMLKSNGRITFDMLRNNYKKRLEFEQVVIEKANALNSQLEQFGFQLQ